MIAGLHVVGSGRPGHTKRWYIYASRGGPRIGIRIGGGKPKALTPVEVAAYHDVMAASAARPANTLAALIRDYRVSPEWRKLSPTTKRQWAIRIGHIEDRWGETPLSVMADQRMRKHIMAWRDEHADTPREADNRVGVLQHLLQWGFQRARLNANVAAGIPRLYKGGNRAKIIWFDHEIERFVAETPSHIADIVRLAAATGLRAGDLAGLEWGDVRDNAIVRVTSKSGDERREAVVPLLDSTRALLTELKSRPRKDGVNTVLVNSFGRSWTQDGLSGSVSREAKRLDIRHTDGRRKHLHDIRGTFATALFAIGFNDEDAAEILGWSPANVRSIRRHYVDRSGRIVAMAERLNGLPVKPVVKPTAAKGLD